MKIEQEIKALELLRDKLKVLNIPQIEYLFEYGRLFENILTEKEEKIFLENLEKGGILALNAIYDDLSNRKVAIGRKIKINTHKFNKNLSEVDKKYLGGIGEFDSNQEQEKSILKKEVLKKLAIEIGSLYYLKNNKDFYDFLLNCNVDKRFFYKPLSSLSDILYPCAVYSASNIYNTIKNPAPKPKFDENENIPEYRKGRCREVFRILAYYSYSKDKNKKILFEIIEKSTDSLSFDGKREEADKFKIKLNEYLKYAGYKIEAGAIEKIDERYTNANIKIFEDKKKGYLMIDERKIPIASIQTAKFQLLKSLCYPEIGLAKTIDAVYEAIDPYIKNKTSNANDKYTEKTYKIKKIKGTIKELQRIFKDAKINNSFKFHAEDNKVWLDPNVKKW